MSKQGEIEYLLREVVLNYKKAAKEINSLANKDNISERNFLDALAEGLGLMKRRSWRLERIHNLLRAEGAECDSGEDRSL